MKAKVTEVNQLTDDELRDQIKRLTEELRAAEHDGTEN